MKKLFLLLLLVPVFCVGLFLAGRKMNPPSSYSIGQPVDSLDHVVVFYNGYIKNVKGRNTSDDGYNIGLRWQCVEFVKRYYYEFYQHKMPNAYGHAKDFFNKKVKDGGMNADRNLTQFSNHSKYKPEVGQIIIFAPTIFNSFGHVAIISKVEKDKIEIIQQNPGPYSKSREWFKLEKKNGRWSIRNDRILGRLGKARPSEE